MVDGGWWIMDGTCFFKEKVGNLLLGEKEMLMVELEPCPAEAPE